MNLTFALGLVCSISLVSSLAKADPDTAPLDTLIIYRKAEDNRNGVAARIIRATRTETHLLIANEFDVLQVVEYFTTGGAETALRAIQNGSSIDVSSCMVPSEIGTSQVPARIDSGRLCTASEITLKMECSLMTRVPTLTAVDMRTFNLSDIERSPLTQTYTRCAKEHP